MEDSISFQNEWNAVKKKQDKIYISYDSANKNCQAGDIGIVEFRHAKEDRGLPIFSCSIAYDAGSREPLFYETYPGSIVDISQLMLNKAAAYGYRNGGFILDRGYFSRENIRYMDHLGYDFVIMLKGMKAFVNEKIRDVLGSFEEKRQYTIRRCQVNRTTVKTKVFYSDEKDRYLHVYYSYSRVASEREDLEAKIDRIAAYLKKQEGQAVVIDKSYMLIAFIALVVRNRMYTKLKDAEVEMNERPNYMNVLASIWELVKIEMIRQADGVYRLDHAVTATQKTILKAFGIDADYVKRKTREISGQLNPKVLKVRT